MKNKPLIPIIWISLAVFVLISFFTLLQEGSRYIGKTYFDTGEFTELIYTFYQNIGPAVLNEFDAEEAKKRVPVSKAEIEDHRNYYGSLPDQVENIQAQYKEQIAEADNNEQMKDVLVKERDDKISNIRKNFDDDKFVEEKIRLEKSELIDSYLSNEAEYYSGVGPLPIAYEFEDIDSGKVYASGSVQVPAAYKKTFSEAKGLYKTGSIFTDINFDSEVEEFSRDSTASYDDVSAHELKRLIGDPVRTFTGTVIIPESAMTEGDLGNDVSRFTKTKYAFYFIWLTALLVGIALVTKFRPKKEWVTDNQFVNRYHKLKIDMRALLLVVSLFMIVEFLGIIANSIQFLLANREIPFFIEHLFNYGLLVILIGLTLFQFVNFIEQLKDEEMLKQEIADSYTTKAWSALQEMFLNKTIGVQTFIMLIGFFLAGIGIVAVAMNGSFLVVYIPAVLFLGLPALYILFRRTAYLNRIIVSTEKMAQGRLHDEIKIEGKSPLADHAKNLNNLREGVRTSMTEQAKSERLKTELITNVSHDLRTPLTSIIAYTDLLKAQDLSDEDRLKYVDILDKKSQRLKTLIEDLFEVSKMASGNMELNKQRVDLTQLLQQALAEQEAEISKTELDIRLSFPETPLVAYVDGKRWWRVLDNLILNALKYAMPGTRVYLTLQQVGNQARFVLKNVSQYELNENGDELFERFKRADTSRHTEGSGLGLAIAQSIIDMHEGKMTIEVDGDLFKVTVEVPLAH